MAHKRLIIPIFIPFGGCTHQCVFCDQKHLTGATGLPSIEDIKRTIETYLSTWKGKGPKEAAFYGGSFTGLPLEAQQSYLDAAGEFLSFGRLDSLRLSTRPDYIDRENAAFLKSKGVGTVELGVQSMSDEVLRLSGRGHTAGHTREAVAILREAGLHVGLQFMPGLPGDTRETVIRTAMEVAALRPDFVRIYPSVVLRDTPMHRMYLNGTYSPWGLQEMVSVCAEAKRLLDEAGVPIIRMGLQTTDDLAASLVAGPFHPSFRQLVEAAI